jgi:osmotically-inducible protein OsmY
MREPNHVLEVAVRETLDWDPLVDDTRVVVKADDGHVTLSGSVPTYYEKVRASEDTRTVAGVMRLTNDLLIGLPGDRVDDAKLTDACNHALALDRFVPNGAVNANATNGVVQLRGHVRSHFQRQAAVFTVSRVDGVLGVEDGVSVSTERTPPDACGHTSGGPQWFRS